MNKFFIFCFFIIFSLHCKALSITIDSSKTYFYNKTFEHLLTPIDTTIDNLHWYHPHNKITPFYYDLGNLGQPVYDFMRYYNMDFGFNKSINSIQCYQYNFTKTPNYTTYKKAFTELNYIIGMKNENMLEATHAQQLNKSISIQGMYRNINSDGTYTNQTVKHNNLNIGLTYLSNNQRYNISINYLYNKNNFKNNGGVTVDSVYEKNYINKNAVPVILNSASLIKQQVWQVDNQFNFGKYQIIRINDTTTIKNYIPFYTLSYQLNYDNEKQKYSDENFIATNYQLELLNIANDTLLSYTNYGVLSNSIFFKSAVNKSISEGKIKSRKTLFSIGIQHQSISVLKFLRNYTEYNIMGHLRINDNKNETSVLKYNAAFDYCFKGYNKNDFKFVVNTTLNFKKYGRVDAMALLQENQPVFGLNHYSSNKYGWDIDKSDWFTFSSAQLGFKYALDKYKFSIAANLYANHNVLFQSANINSSSLTTSLITIQKKLQFKKIYFSNNVIYRLKHNQNSVYFDVPKWQYLGQLYYQDYLFKKALLLQCGIQLHYFSAIQQQQFSAQYFDFIALNVFDNTTKKEYQRLQFFMNAKIKQARLFLLVDNILQGVDGHGVYVSKNYPLPDLAIKFGINWRFFDK